MRTLLLIFVLGLVCPTASAQPAAEQYIDIVQLFKGDPVEGTILTYEYNTKVIIVTENGTVRELPWENVKRVQFRQDHSRKSAIRQKREEYLPEKEPLSTPSRKLRHQITSAVTFGRVTNPNLNFGLPSTTIGGGVAYHLLYDIPVATLGFGLDLNLMNHQRRENVLAATLLAERALGQGRFRPLIRMETGPSFPFGGSEEGGEEITSRSISILYHPAVGVEITPRNGGWGKMTIDVGYRFLNSKFELTTASLDVVERNVNYRRLTLRGGMRF
ncbi:hypothetical protein FUA23_14835 [Neolewinella aurantiaca]|uniref:Outer membrane protein beta-barrel domain-containing protein n=1 Tax=Neolewinella aurantiaca TaxID=2602767 RepID=A0A5C7FFL1_9BACT|nr:hypothetical protein [Neolewinella aurantiaca]TXF88410.1 hypothetical protein FUA23_14835 [Neolewinella aurantiaca]